MRRNTLCHRCPGTEGPLWKELHVTKQALADNIASAAEIVMGEADESTPAAIIRGLGISITDTSGVETIAASECLFMGLLEKER